MTLTDGFTLAAVEAWRFVDPAVAQHEAAHAVAAYRLGFTIRQVRVDRNEFGLGHTDLVGDLDRLSDHLTVIMCGPLAQGSHLSWQPYSMAAGDEGAAAAIVRELGLSEKGWDRSDEMARLLLRNHRRAVDHLAERLIRASALPGVVAENVIREAS